MRQQHEVVGHAAARYRAEDVIPTRGTGGSKHRRIRRIVNYADAANPTKILLAEVNVARISGALVSRFQRGDRHEIRAGGTPCLIANAGLIL